MLHTSNNIQNPGLRTLPPGVERFFVRGGGLSVIEVSPEDKIEIINEEIVWCKFLSITNPSLDSLDKVSTLDSSFGYTTNNFEGPPLEYVRGSEISEII